VSGLPCGCESDAEHAAIEAVSKNIIESAYDLASGFLVVLEWIDAGEDITDLVLRLLEPLVPDAEVSS